MKNSIKLLSSLLLSCLIAFSSAWVGAQSEENTEILFNNEALPVVVVNPSAQSKYAIAVADLVPLKINSKTGEPASQLPERLRANLDMTGLFIPLDKRSFIEADPRAGIDKGRQIDYTDWSRLGAEFLIKGGITLSSSKIVLEMRLFDINSGTMMLGKRYDGRLKDARRMINLFTNEVLLAITGEPGVFGSEIAFVSGTRSNKSIMKTELGSDEATMIAGAKGGPSTQPAMGPGGKTAWVHRQGTEWQLIVDGKKISGGDLHLSPAFMPNGTVVASLSQPASTDIYAFSGSSRRVLVQGGVINVSPTISPDGSRIAFISDRTGGARLHVASIGGGGAQLMNIPGGKTTDPHWSPKGDKIVFVSRERDVCVVNADGSGFQQLTSGQGTNRDPSFSPDGRMIVFSSTRGGKSQLYVMAANGDRQQPLMPDYTGDQHQPSWSPEMPSLN